MGVKIWSLCSVSSTLSHANLEQPFRTLAIKWEVNMLLKKSSCFLSSCVSLCASVFIIIESLWYGKWVYNTWPQKNCPRKELSVVVDCCQCSFYLFKFTLHVSQDASRGCISYRCIFIMMVCAKVSEVNK